jgi:hypothetical protein
MGIKNFIHSDGSRGDCDDGHGNCCLHIFVMLHNNV